MPWFPEFASAAQLAREEVRDFVRELEREALQYEAD